MIEIIEKEQIAETIQRIENEKEISFISTDDKSNYDFENKMPKKIADNLLNKDFFDKDVKEIGRIAKELLKGM